jgi:hypothetical protein
VTSGTSSVTSGTSSVSSSLPLVTP